MQLEVAYRAQLDDHVRRHILRWWCNRCRQQPAIAE